MTLLSGDMQTLAQTLVQDYQTRVDAVADLRNNVKTELNQYRNIQRTMSAEQEKTLDQNMAAIRKDVAEAALATSKFLQEVNLRNEVVTAEQRQNLSDHMQTLRAQVNKASQATADFMKEVDLERQFMNSEQRQRLEAQMDDLHNQVNNLREAAATTLKASGDAHRSMAAQQKHIRANDRSQLLAKVIATRKSILSQRSSVRSDISEASKIWANISELKQKSRQAKSTAAPVQAPRAAWVAVASAQTKETSE